METFDVCVLLCTGLATGFTLGFSFRSRRFKNLRNELEWERIKYGKLADAYTDCLTEKYTKERYAGVKKKGPGRPKGSKNKTKQDGRPTTRKYTRKSSK